MMMMIMMMMMTMMMMMIIIIMIMIYFFHTRLASYGICFAGEAAPCFNPTSSLAPIDTLYEA